jgi:hypothetical protein
MQTIWGLAVSNMLHCPLSCDTGQTEHKCYFRWATLAFAKIGNTSRVLVVRRSVDTLLQPFNLHPQSRIWNTCMLWFQSAHLVLGYGHVAKVPAHKIVWSSWGQLQRGQHYHTTKLNVEALWDGMFHCKNKQLWSKSSLPIQSTNKNTMISRGMSGLSRQTSEANNPESS